MAEITRREIKAEPLTWEEVDNNFAALNDDIQTRMPKAGGQFVGIITVPDQLPTDNSNNIANTRFVKEQIAAGVGEVTTVSIGLGNVDNTSDINKPVSNPQANANAAVLNAAKLYTDDKASAVKSEAIAAGMLDATTRANAARDTAISTASVDATTKANAAMNAAVTASASDATTKATAATNSAIAAAAIDSQNKANAAEANAISSASIDATEKANMAKAEAIAASTSIEHIGSGGDSHALAVPGEMAGFISGSDQAKLNGIEVGANKYILPEATSNELGGLKLGYGLTVDELGKTNVNINTVPGNADTASRLAAPVLISLTGDVSGDTLFDGDDNVNIVTTLAISGVVAGTYPVVTVDDKGIVINGRTLTSNDIPILNQNTDGTASNVTGVVSIANGGTGSANASNALLALGGYPNTNPNNYITLAQAPVQSIDGHTGEITKEQIGIDLIDNTSDLSKPVSIAQAAADTNVLNSAATDATTKANTAKNDAISAAALDASIKANNAYSNALADAAVDAFIKTNTAISTASSDATSKANAAESNAKAASTPIAHVGTGGAAHALAVPNVSSGFISGADQAKLNSVSLDANNYILPIATDTVLGGVKQGLNNTIDSNGVLNVTVTTIAGNSTTATQLQTARNINGVPFDGTQDIVISKTSLGLSNVDNTSDLNKPVSTAQASADATVLSSARAYADNLVTGLWDDRGNYDASVDAYPTTGGSGTSGAILKGDIWTVTAEGILGSTIVDIRQTIRALVDNPGQVTGNWAISNSSMGMDNSVTQGIIDRTASQDAIYNAIHTAVNNSGTADRLTTARNISLVGIVEGTVSFDGSANVSMNTSIVASGIVAGEYPVVTVNANGLATNGRALLATDLPAHTHANIGTASALETSNNYQINSLGIGTAASGVTGEIIATGNITAYFSDERLKNIESNIPNALDKICELNGVYYTNNEVANGYGYSNKERQVGVIAQQIQKVLPELVSRAPFDRSYDFNGNSLSKSGQDYLTVKYDGLIPLLIEAIKELEYRLSALEKKNMKS